MLAWAMEPRISWRKRRESKLMLSVNRWTRSSAPESKTPLREGLSTKNQSKRDRKWDKTNLNHRHRNLRFGQEVGSSRSSGRGDWCLRSSKRFQGLSREKVLWSEPLVVSLAGAVRGIAATACLQRSTDGGGAMLPKLCHLPPSGVSLVTM